MLALAEVKASTCHDCGGDLNETLVTEAEDYTVPPPARCGKCTRMAIEYDSYVKEGTKHAHALRWQAIRRR